MPIATYARSFSHRHAQIASVTVGSHTITEQRRGDMKRGREYPSARSNRYRVFDPPISALERWGCLFLGNAGLLGGYESFFNFGFFPRKNMRRGLNLGNFCGKIIMVIYTIPQLWEIS